jgi:hypothetical protein
MQTDRATLNYTAAVISTASSVAGLGALLVQRGPRDRVARFALLSGLLGLLGTVAWLLAARGDHLEAKQAPNT